MRAVADHGRPLVDDPARLAAVAALGVDETAWLRANRRHHYPVRVRAGRHRHRPAPRRRPRPHRPCGVALAGRPGSGLAGRRDGRRAGPAQGVRERRRRPPRPRHPRRGPLPRDQARGRRRDPLYRTRKLLLKACEHLDGRGWARLAAALQAGDPDGQVAAAWQLKEITRDLYRADSIHAARPVLHLLYTWAETGTIPELRRLARTVRRWEDEILAWHTTGGASNGPTEAVNLSIKHIKRVGRGFRNFDNYRLRLLLHCGHVNWHTQPAARLRGRGPQFAA